MDNTEFHDIFNKLRSSLFYFALKLTKNKEDAKDLLQETAMLAYSNLHRFEPGTHFKSWIFTIMRNSFINEYRRTRIRNKVSLSIEEIKYAMENKTVANQAISRMMQEELAAIINKLSHEHKLSFLMFYQGYHYIEIADHMKLPIGTVKSRIFYARKQLRQMVASEYGTSTIQN
ncbi:MAG: sigma-70 family RNA polymerase sigma factor [Saprospiraceae bacterium]|nr:sigma-70 family RNA polymerase sigma factor [Saprospiraceae bacterium]